MLHMPRDDMLLKDKRQSYLAELEHAVIAHKPTLLHWVLGRDGLRECADDEVQNAEHCSSHLETRLRHLKNNPKSTSLQSDVAIAPFIGTCDAYAGLTVFLKGVPERAVKEFALIPATSYMQNTNDRQISQVGRIGTNATSIANPGKRTRSKKGPYSVSSSFMSHPPPDDVIPVSSRDTGGPDDAPPVSSRNAEVLDDVAPVLSRDTEGVSLDLPILVAEYKKQAGASYAMKATNQLRMYLTASVKFLESVGITGFIVYGMITDGPYVAFPAAVMTENGVNVLFLVLICSELTSCTRLLTCLNDSLRQLTYRQRSERGSAPRSIPVLLMSSPKSLRKPSRTLTIRLLSS